MNKPNGFDNVKTGGFTPLEVGGHILQIMEVVEMKSKSGRDMLKVSFDTAKNDRQPLYFSELYKDDIRPNKVWSNNGTSYILTDDNDGNCSRQLKTFITSVEDSNTGFEVQWGDDFCKCLKGKLVGGVFGIVEEEYNGKITRKRKLRWFRGVDGIEDAQIPDEKIIPRKPNDYQSVDSDGFMEIPNIDGEELPFS